MVTLNGKAGALLICVGLLMGILWGCTKKEPIALPTQEITEQVLPNTEAGWGPIT